MGSGVSLQLPSAPSVCSQEGKQTEWQPPYLLLSWQRNCWERKLLPDSLTEPELPGLSQFIRLVSARSDEEAAPVLHPRGGGLSLHGGRPVGVLPGQSVRPDPADEAALRWVPAAGVGWVFWFKLGPRPSSDRMWRWTCGALWENNKIIQNVFSS